MRDGDRADRINEGHGGEIGRADRLQWSSGRRWQGLVTKGLLVMFEVTVQAGFSSGHYLRNYRGKCENPHGHNYRVLVTLQVMRPVVDRLDHQMINDLEPFNAELNPSAENLARYFFEQTAGQLREMTLGRVRVKDCTLYETDTSFARYYE